MKELEIALTTYIALEHTQEECIGFIDGFKAAKERMYSGEEVLEHLNHLIMMPSSKLDKFTDDEEMVTMKWFEQFKKK